MERTITTKENFFDGLKPSPDKEYKSKAVTELLSELKQFIVKKDVNGFWNFVHNNPKVEALSAKEKQCFLSAFIIDGDATVMEVLIDISDLMGD